MKRLAMTVLGLMLAGFSTVQTAHGEVNLNVNIGVPPVPIVVAEPPEFIYPASLGFYVAVGVPYDIFYVGTTYYLYRDNAWYQGRYYNGPWRQVERRSLPPGLRKHKFERIRYYRDEEYRHYRDEHDDYRGRRFRPDKEWKEDRQEERRHDREERRHEGHGRHGDHDHDD